MALGEMAQPLRRAYIGVDMTDPTGVASISILIFL